MFQLIKPNYMLMMYKPELFLYGGYGEHGRSCFVIKRASGHCIMIDCGVLDTDPQPYPEVPHDVIINTDYLLLTHCHKDHVGAVEYFIAKGFHGMIVTEEITTELRIIKYGDVKELVCEGYQEIYLEQDIRIGYGRSGHCAGSLWFYVEVDGYNFVFSGDYQADTVVNAVDVIEHIYANEAVIDCGHDEVEISAELCRKNILEKIKMNLLHGKTVFLPVQQYGRGLELLWLVKHEFPNIVCMGDKQFIENSKLSVSFSRSYKEECLEILKGFVNEIHEITSDTQGIIFLSDTHFEQEESLELFQKYGSYAFLISTGRVKHNQVIEGLIQKGQGVHLPYCHHQSEYDLQKVIEKNEFQKVYPYHGYKKRILMKVGQI